MLPLILIAALALSGAPGDDEEEPGAEPGMAAPTVLRPSRVPIVYGGAGYQAAFDRAQRYEKDNRANDYRDKVFGPAVNPQLTAIFRTCVGPRTAEARTPFVLVVSFAPDGAADAIYADKQTPQSRCMAERLVDLRAPRPPVRDFAEEIRIVP